MATKKITTKIDTKEKKSPKKEENVVDGRFAVIQFTPHQYLVKVGDVLEVEKINLKEGEKLKADKVLLLADGDVVKVGTPYLEKVSVEMEHLDTKKAPKIRVVKYRSKSRYRRVQGHRQTYSYLKVISIK
jgi:large subunit ribosomal protein L21